jgi:hypothetical protein
MIGIAGYRRRWNGMVGIVERQTELWWWMYESCECGQGGFGVGAKLPLESQRMACGLCGAILVSVHVSAQKGKPQLVTCIT